MSLMLHFQTPDGEFRAVDLGRLVDGMVIGRDRDVAQLVIPDPQVSRAHCVINIEDGRYTVEDLGSRNGTWANDEKVSKSVIQPRDVLRVGTTNIRVAASGGDGEYSLLGKAMGGFEFQEVLGQGSYGTVYRGLQVALNRPVAIKVLDKRHQSNPERVTAFLEEARHAGRLNHPNVVQVHDVCQEDGNFFLVMELMTGGSMSDRLRVDGPIDPETCVQILIDIGHALGYAESQRLVHRDVKPDNILVNEEGVFKLADLGIAAPINQDGMARQVKAFGSAHYVAPEQARGGSIDGRADIYALGAALFHLVSGKPMFEGTSREIVAAHINRGAPRLKEARPEFPIALLDLIQHMLEKEPGKRPPTGNALAEMAQEIQVKLTSGQLASGGRSRPRRRRRRRRRR